MFSGIIYDIGTIKSIKQGNGQRRISFTMNKEIINPAEGMSIAINGICLTVVEIIGEKEFSADATEETIKKTNMKILKSGSNVNIEFPLTAGGFLSGHIVQGHIDCTGKVINVLKKGANIIMKATYPKEFIKYLVEKGSVAIDGISLTAYNVNNSTFQASIIPETFSNTTIKYYKTGTVINIEFDIIGKYVEKWVNKRGEWL